MKTWMRPCSAETTTKRPVKAHVYSKRSATLLKVQTLDSMLKPWRRYLDWATQEPTRCELARCDLSELGRLGHSLGRHRTNMTLSSNVPSWLIRKLKWKKRRVMSKKHAKKRWLSSKAPPTLSCPSTRGTKCCASIENLTAHPKLYSWDLAGTKTKKLYADTTVGTTQMSWRISQK